MDSYSKLRPVSLVKPILTNPLGCSKSNLYEFLYFNSMDDCDHREEHALNRPGDPVMSYQLEGIDPSLAS